MKDLLSVIIDRAELFVKKHGMKLYWKDDGVSGAWGRGGLEVAIVEKGRK